MATTFEAVHPRPAGILEGAGSLVEGVGGVGAVVLAILGLAGLLPLEIAAIAAIAVGVSVAVEGGTVASRLSRTLGAAGMAQAEFAELGGGMSAELLGGTAGGVLGLLAVLHIVPMVLVPVAVVVLGAALLMGSGATSRVSTLTATWATRPEVQPAAREALLAATSAQMMVGIGAVALGIIGIVGFSPVTTSLVAFLILGAALVLNGTAIGGSVMAVLHR
jgi:hypothetical protein